MGPKSQPWRRISSCQRFDLMSILKTYRTVSNDALCLLTGIPPVKIQIKNNNIKYHIFNEDENIEIKGEILCKHSFMHDLKTFEYPEFDKTCNFEVLVDENNIRDAHVVIYTDGSKMDVGTSSAFMAFKGQLETF